MPLTFISSLFLFLNLLSSVNNNHIDCDHFFLNYFTDNRTTKLISPDNEIHLVLITDTFK